MAEKVTKIRVDGQLIDFGGNGGDGLQFYLTMDADRKIIINANRELTDEDVVSFVHFGPSQSHIRKDGIYCNSKFNRPHYAISQYKSTHPKSGEGDFHPSMTGKEQWKLIRSNSTKYAYFIYIPAKGSYIDDDYFRRPFAEIVSEVGDCAHFQLGRRIRLSMHAYVSEHKLHQYKFMQGIAINGMVAKIGIIVRNYGWNQSVTSILNTRRVVSLTIE